jgi:hypothetical protein
MGTRQIVDRPSGKARLLSTNTFTISHVVSRIAASLLGSYAFVWGFASFGCALGLAAGMTFDDARTLLFLLAFLVFLACFFWAFACARLLRVWAVLLGGGALMTVAAWLLLGTLS